VSDALLGEVGNGGEQLLEVGPGKFRGETARLGDVVEELSSLCQFQHDQWSLLHRFLRQLDFGLGTVVNHVDQVGVFHPAQQFSFHPVGRFLAGATGINLERIGLSILAAKVDTG
jgi:hypothetical protein